MWIDIHTHTPPDPGQKTILSLYNDFHSVQSGRYYSMGIHPWHIEEDFESQFENLISYANNVSVMAIGEAGLDKICKTDFKLQQQIFSRQIQLANELQKPLIIHCVKAWAEVFSLLEKGSVNVPVVFHGFNKNKTLANTILEKGFYLSFGKSLKHQNQLDLLKQISMEKLFLETDDASVNIDEIYKLASNALSIDMNSLSLQIQKNAANIFDASFFI